MDCIFCGKEIKRLERYNGNYNTWYTHTTGDRTCHYASGRNKYIDSDYYHKKDDVYLLATPAHDLENWSSSGNEDRVKNKEKHNTWNYDFPKAGLLLVDGKLQLFDDIEKLPPNMRKKA